MREAALRPGARRFYAALSEGEQAEIDRRLARLEQDPSVDNRLTFDFPRPPLMFRLFDDGIWQIVYYLPDEATVAIYAIAPSARR